MDLSSYFRSCAVCHYCVPPINWLCSRCWLSLKKNYLPKEGLLRVEKNLPHLKLIDWGEENHFLITQLINSLKESSSNAIVKQLAEACFIRFIHFNFWKRYKNPCFIPAPSRHKNQQDHARRLAEAFCFYFGGTVNPILKHVNSSEQKTKNRLARSKKQFLLKGDIPDRPLIFIDDVLTTGFTARAAFKTLNSPKNFLICTLCWKQAPDKV